MKFHLIIATILITFISCDKEVYNNISEEELPIWQTNDTLCFINNEGLADTFLIKITDEYTVSDKRYYYQVISIFYNKLSNSTTSPVKKMNSKHKLATNFQVNSYYYPTLYSNTEPEKNIEINGVKYHNVFTIEKKNINDSLPCILKYSHQYGILQYGFKDGLIYNLNLN